jgi:hypothetical protein
MNSSLVCTALQRPTAVSVDVDQRCALSARQFLCPRQRGRCDREVGRARRARRDRAQSRFVLSRPVRARGKKAAVRPAGEWLADYALEVDNLRAALAECSATSKVNCAILAPRWQDPRGRSARSEAPSRNDADAGKALITMRAETVTATLAAFLMLTISSYATPRATKISLTMGIRSWHLTDVR